MLIKVSFTLDVEPGQLSGLMELAGGVGDEAAARDFVEKDAAEYSADYLSDNGVRVREIRYRKGK